MRGVKKVTPQTGHLIGCESVIYAKPKTPIQAEFKCSHNVPARSARVWEASAAVAHTRQSDGVHRRVITTQHRPDHRLSQRLHMRRRRLNASCTRARRPTASTSADTLTAPYAQLPLKMTTRMVPVSYHAPPSAHRRRLRPARPLQNVRHSRKSAGQAPLPEAPR